jgi:hypothetical protein
LIQLEIDQMSPAMIHMNRKFRADVRPAMCGCILSSFILAMAQQFHPIFRDYQPEF